MTRVLDDISQSPALRSGPLRPDSAEDLMVRLLQNLGSRKEVEQYLRLFSSVEEQRFAVIKVSGGVVQEELEALASSIAFLDKVGLTPVIIHGAGPQLLQAELAAGVSTTKTDRGERIVNDDSIVLARKVYQRENLRIVGALEALGTRARPIPTGAFVAEKSDDRLGFAPATRPQAMLYGEHLDSGPVLLAISPAGQEMKQGQRVGAARDTGTDRANARDRSKERVGFVFAYVILRRSLHRTVRPSPAESSHWMILDSA